MGDHLSPAQLSQISRHHPTWPWALGMVVGCLVGGFAMSSDGRKEAKQELAEEKAQRGQDVKELKEKFDAVKSSVESAQRDTADKLNRIEAALERLEKRARR